MKTETMIKKCDKIINSTEPESLRISAKLYRDYQTSPRNFYPDETENITEEIRHLSKEIKSLDPESHLYMMLQFLFT